MEQLFRKGHTLCVPVWDGSFRANGDGSFWHILSSRTKRAKKNRPHWHILVGDVIIKMDYVKNLGG